MNCNLQAARVMGGTPRIMAKATPAELTESREAINRNHAQRGVAIVVAAEGGAGEEVEIGSFVGCLLFREN